MQFPKISGLWTFLLGIGIGLVVSGGIFWYKYTDAERASAQIIGQLRSEQQRGAELVDSIGSGLADCLKREQAAQGLFEKNRIILTEIRAIVKSLPDSQ